MFDPKHKPSPQEDEDHDLWEEEEYHDEYEDYEDEWEEYDETDRW